jgi:hypothetical protein
MVAVGLSFTNLVVDDRLALLDKLLASGHSSAARAFENELRDVTHLDVFAGFRSWVGCFVDVRRCAEIVKEFRRDSAFVLVLVVVAEGKLS